MADFFFGQVNERTVQLLEQPVLKDLLMMVQEENILPVFFL